MEEAHRKKIEEIVGQMQCPKGFKCAESGFTNLCRARDIGLETYLECFEQEPSECKFSVPFGDSYFCHCPLRVYIARNLRRGKKGDGHKKGTDGRTSIKL